MVGRKGRKEITENLHYSQMTGWFLKSFRDTVSLSDSPGEPCGEDFISSCYIAVKVDLEEVIE